MEKVQRLSKARNTDVVNVVSRVGKTRNGEHLKESSEDIVC
ncbi:hypothetical protein [Serratia phage vB_SmaM_Yaphecito]|uniref:Uncharacterized protein n=1 Tax=Serratia phage vB_SmaM_Yaphecito TaxID=2777368 RepID=A0A7T3NBR4_9CAUD|nr:hypothetical protein [Serratia phage vB_SmaM_Yaphecito]